MRQLKQPKRESYMHNNWSQVATSQCQLANYAWKLLWRKSSVLWKDVADCSLSNIQLQHRGDQESEPHKSYAQIAPPEFMEIHEKYMIVIVLSY